MRAPEQPRDEKTRLSTLRSLHILDSAPEERFDRLTRMARRMFDVPISLVSLVDAERQWFKSKQGLEVEEGPRETSFCGHAILGDTTLIVPDALEDERFFDNPLVTGEPNIRFYAGVPLRAIDGSKLGTLCLIDTKPRNFEDEDAQLLLDLATITEQELAATRLATLDDLTGIYNRRGFFSMGNHTQDLCRRKKWPVTLVLFDLDKFKAINDEHGHSEGDQVLIAFANAMKKTFRESDVIARLGGDEFVALLPDTDEAGLGLVLSRFENDVLENSKKLAESRAISFSSGSISCACNDKMSLEEMMRNADERMYEAKKGE